MALGLAASTFVFALGGSIAAAAFGFLTGILAVFLVAASIRIVRARRVA
jgi:hypothetical protein